ncbi:MAG: outer membrane beta-barrel protein [Bacteroidales bacterium]|nr:outer membrane beta-barrel protein [Bacteroidales bacterium]
MMKNHKLIVALILLWLCNTSLFAQNRNNRLVRGGVHFGFEIPVNNKTFSPDFTIYKSLNFKVGGMVRIGYDFAGQVGFYYDINKLQVENTQTNANSAIELGVLKIPFLFSYGYAFSKNNVLRFNIGLQYDALVHMSKNKIDLNKKAFTIHNMSVLGGIGVDLKNISIDISYEKAVKAMASANGSKRYADMICIMLGVVF